MTSIQAAPTPGPYLLAPSTSQTNFRRIGAHGIPVIAEIELRWISINEHDATHFLFVYAEPLYRAGQNLIRVTDQESAQQDHSTAMNLLRDTLALIETRLRARRGKPIEPVAGPYSIAPVRKDGKIILGAQGVPILARIEGRYVEPAVQFANTILLTKSPELLRAARLLVEGDTTDSPEEYDQGLDLMRSTILTIETALQVL